MIFSTVGTFKVFYHTLTVLSVLVPNPCETKFMSAGLFSLREDYFLKVSQ